MNAAVFLRAFNGHRPIESEGELRSGEVRLSVIQVGSVTRVAVTEASIPRIEAFAHLLGGQVCRDHDLVCVILPPA